ncbi:hypothetical protein CQA38_02900 [Campylobacter sp. MIT 12-5580]|uniref:hypothetical protein n=1 Tax=Campylobacter sp. MIT 12-5580 TaxID=2040651 RepID=UPI0010F78B70|nr:hypothetical protein [Campylobacter sp. MIT 12-5580]TKX29737.1 hypothetical protein CQA38_02900 [Campylobacter sp. MIT 12-5580]
MNNLENLNLKEVSQRTQIEMAFLEALLEKDFKKLSRFNVKGFLKILSREYDLDFTLFLEEYNAFLNESETNEDKVLSQQSGVPPKLDAYSHKSSSFWIWFLALIIIIALGWFIYQYGWFKFGTSSEQITQNSSSSVVQIIDEAQNNVKNTDSKEVSLNESESEQNTSENDTEAKNKENEQEKSEQNTSSNNEISSINLQNTAQTQPIVNENVSQKEAIFSTSGKVWVGFIDLDSNSKSAVVTENNFSVDLNKNQLLLIGATALTLIDDEGKEQKFPAGTSKRFLVQNGKIKSISLAEFMSHNRGKEW